MPAAMVAGTSPPRAIPTTAVGLPLRGAVQQRSDHALGLVIAEEHRHPAGIQAFPSSVTSCVFLRTYQIVATGPSQVSVMPSLPKTTFGASCVGRAVSFVVATGSRGLPQHPALPAADPRVRGAVSGRLPASTLSTHSTPRTQSNLSSPAASRAEAIGSGLLQLGIRQRPQCCHGAGELARPPLPGRPAGACCPSGECRGGAAPRRDRSRRAPLRPARAAPDKRRRTARARTSSPLASAGSSMCCQAAIAALPDWFAPSVQNSGAPGRPLRRRTIAGARQRRRTIEPERRGMCRPCHPAHAARRIERPSQSHLGKRGADLEEVRPRRGRGQEMQEVSLRQCRPHKRVAGRSADRPRAPPRRPPPLRAVGARNVATSPTGDWCGQSPHVVPMSGDRDPALARIDAPVRMCRDCGAVSVH